MEQGLQLSLKWAAPEALFELDFSSKSDVWSFRILATEVLCNGVERYPGYPPRQVKSGLRSGLRTPVPASTPVRIKTLLGNCWNIDKDKRPNFRQILFELTFQKALS